MSRLISIRDASKILNCAEVTVRGYVADGKLSSEKVGHAVVLFRSEVDEFANARRVMKQGVSSKLEPEIA